MKAWRIGTQEERKLAEEVRPRCHSALPPFRRFLPSLLIFPLFHSGLLPPASATEAFVRTTLATQGNIWVGQRVTVVVDLLSPGFFSGSPAFDLPRVPGVLLFEPDERPVLGTETIGGSSYAVQHHELAAFPQRAGRVTIPPFTVRFATREGAAPPVEQRLNTRPVVFEAKLPPGAKGLSTLISARELTAKESWQPQPGAAKVGDAFTRTITFTAPDVPAMLLPPFPSSQLPGLGVYQKEPQVRDRNERGQPVGERTETITYICEQPGRVRLPATKLTWWDLDDHQLKTVEFPARILDISPNPALLPRGPQTQGPSNGKPMLRPAVGVGLGILCLAACLWWARPRWPQWWRRTLAFWSPIHLEPLNPGAIIGPPPAPGRTTTAAIATRHRFIQSNPPNPKTNAGG